MLSGCISTAVFAIKNCEDADEHPAEPETASNSGHALISGFGCSCFRPQSGHPCCFVAWKLSSFRLRHLTAIRTFENQIVSHSGVSDRRSHAKSGSRRRSWPQRQLTKQAVFSSQLELGRKLITQAKGSNSISDTTLLRSSFPTFSGLKPSIVPLSFQLSFGTSLVMGSTAHEPEAQ